MVGTFPSDPKEATPFAAAIALLFIFVFNAFCVRVLIGLLRSEVLSTLSNAKLLLNPATVEEPVPPFAMATTPLTLVALPFNVPEKAPLASLLTIAFAKFVLVAVEKASTADAILSLVLPPTEITVGAVAVPAKSPDNKILPFEVVVASATELVMEPDASANAFAT